MISLWKASRLEERPIFLKLATPLPALPFESPHAVRDATVSYFGRVLVGLQRCHGWYAGILPRVELPDLRPTVVLTDLADQTWVAPGGDLFRLQFDPKWGCVWSFSGGYAIDTGYALFPEGFFLISSSHTALHGGHVLDESTAPSKDLPDYQDRFLVWLREQVRDHAAPLPIDWSAHVRVLYQGE